MNKDPNQMNLLEHLLELRRRLLWSAGALLLAFVGCFFFSSDIFSFLAQPLSDILLAQGLEEQQRRMIFTGLAEVFFTYVKTALVAAFFVSCPIFLTQLWLFVSPGLYGKERRALAPFLVASPLLFFGGGALVYYVVFPLAARFFISFEAPGGEQLLPVHLEPRVAEYFSLMIKLIFAFGICFQLPVLMTLLARVGLVSARGMASKRKYAILGVFIVAAIFTPPDPLSQLSLALPIVLLYEVSIMLARLVEKRRGAPENETEQA